MHWNSFLITLKSGWITDTEMIEALEFVSDKIGIIMGAVLGIIVVIAIIRTLLKASKGESISIPPVGVMNDLPSSVTGINKIVILIHNTNIIQPEICHFGSGQGR